MAWLLAPRQAGLEPPVSQLASGARSPLGSLCAGSANVPQSLWLQSQLTTCPSGHIDSADTQGDA